MLCTLKIQCNQSHFINNYLLILLLLANVGWGWAPSQNPKIWVRARKVHGKMEADMLYSIAHKLHCFVPYDTLRDTLVIIGQFHADPNVVLVIQTLLTLMACWWNPSPHPKAIGLPVVPLGDGAQYSTGPLAVSRLQHNIWLIITKWKVQWNNSFLNWICLKLSSISLKDTFDVMNEAYFWEELYAEVTIMDSVIIKNNDNSLGVFWQSILGFRVYQLIKRRAIFLLKSTAH